MGVVRRVALLALAFVCCGASHVDAARAEGREAREELERRLAAAEDAARIPLLIEIAKLEGDAPASILARMGDALALLASFPSSAYESDALAVRSWAWEALGDYDSAFDDARRAEELAKEAGDDVLIANAHRQLARVAWRRGDLDEALEQAERSRARLEPRGGSEELALTLNLVGAIHNLRNELDAALEGYLAAMEMSRELGDERTAAISQTNVGSVYWQLGQREEALRTFLAALEVQERFDSQRDVSAACTNVALVLIELARPREALPYLERALAIVEASGDLYHQAKVLSNFGYAHEALGDLDTARDEHERALAIRERIGDKDGIQRSNSALASVLLKAGAADEAVAALERSVALAQQTGNRGLEVALLESLSVAREANADLGGALEALRRHHGIQSELSDEEGRARLAEMRVRYETAEREKDLAQANDLAESRREKVVLLVIGSALLLASLLVVAALYALRVRGQRALAESEQRYRTLFDTSIAPTFLIDTATRRVVDLNRPARELCGDPPAGDLALDELEPEWIRVALCHLFESDDEPGALDECWVERSGRMRHSEVRASSVTVDGRECRLVGVRDVTELRAQEEARLREDRMESLGVLAGGIAHDFNNALAAIVGNVELARVGDPAKRERMLEKAAQAAIGASRLTAQLLAFARGGKPARRATDVGALVRDAIELAGAGSQLPIDVDVSGDLWCAEVDPGQLGQVVSNLVINARQATGEDGRLRVHASNFEGVPPTAQAAESGRFVLLEFEDNGAGIPEAIRDRVFDPYFTTKAGGSGLGLATAFTICRNHGGTLTLESREGHGTTFRVYLPAADGQAATAARTPEVEPSGGGSVLVLDDEKPLRDVLAGMLEQWGFEVESVADGRTAVQRYVERLRAGDPFDLLIMDLTIPGGMGGRQALAEIRAHDPRARAIVASGYSDDPTMANHRAAGFLAALTKPFQRAELARVVSEVLRTETPAKAEPAAMDREPSP